MKKSILIAFISFLFLSSISANSLEEKCSNPNKEVIKTKSLKPCTVIIKGTFDGVEVDLEITVDASWVECTFFKRGVRKAVEEALKKQ